jgi:hypothetical protein
MAATASTSTSQRPSAPSCGRATSAAGPPRPCPPAASQSEADAPGVTPSQRQSPSGHRIGGGALLQSGEKALSTVFGGLFGLADQFVFGFTRLGPRIVLETRQGARRTQASQVISKSRSGLLGVAFERVQFQRHSSVAPSRLVVRSRNVRNESRRVSRRLPRGSDWHRNRLGKGRRVRALRLRVRVEGQFTFNATAQMLNAALAGAGLARAVLNGCSRAGAFHTPDTTSSIQVDASSSGQRDRPSR